MGRRWKRTLSQMRAFYSDKRGWLLLAASSVVVAYGGGAAMFWFHAIYLGEGGPAISPWLHWLLDSTAGFVTLTPLLAVLLPVVVTTGPQPRSRVALRVGGLVGLATAPAPLLHDELIGQGTWLANRVTAWLGNGHEPTGTPQDIPWVAEFLQQVGAGVLTYIPLIWLTLLVLSAVVEIAAEAEQIVEANGS